MRNVFGIGHQVSIQSICGLFFLLLTWMLMLVCVCVCVIYSQTNIQSNDVTNINTDVITSTSERHLNEKSITNLHITFISARQKPTNEAGFQLQNQKCERVAKEDNLYMCVVCICVSVGMVWLICA